ncbi:MAG: ankyrin repeat domain-containing protein [Amoebophilaceae bacterium]|nr:ankyrin repeat domain-containing protein [Amoebophilaceae bacterium]
MEEDTRPLTVAAANENRLQLLEAFLDAGVDVETRDQESSTLLYIAANRGYTEMADMLAKKVMIDAVRNDGTPPMHAAARHGGVEIVNLLLKKGAYKNAKSYQGDTPLHLAASSGNLAVVKRLLAETVEVNARNEEGITALHAVASNHPVGEKDNIRNDVDIVNALLAAGADIKAENKEGDTPLHAAAAKGNTEIVQIFIKKKADVNAQNRQKHTPLFAASAEGDLEVVNLLIAAGATVQVQGNETTPLMAAVLNGHIKVASVLAQKCSHLDHKLIALLFKKCEESSSVRNPAMLSLFTDPRLRENCTTVTSGASRMRGFLPDIIDGMRGINTYLFSIHALLSYFYKGYNNQTQSMYASGHELSQEELFMNQCHAAKDKAKQEG